MLAKEARWSASAFSREVAQSAFPEPAGSPLPDFLVIGAMKAGTTSLYHYLRAHPEVFMAPVKELDFFVEKGNWKRGLGWYREQFRGAPPNVMAIGEASTSYTKSPTVDGVPERIAAHLPQARLIYVLRDPIARIRSHYQHRVAVGSERAPIEEAVFREPIYLDCSRYAFQVQQYLRYFPVNRLLLITSEELRHSRRPTMRRVYEFLGVDASRMPAGLEREFYQTQGRVTYSPAGWRVRRMLKKYVPASKRAKEFVDLSMARSLSWMSRGADRADHGSLIVPDDLRDRLAGILAEDVAALRSFMPEGFDGWGIA